MECCKWEEHGLLYSSGELDGKNARDFEEHLKECEECRKELYLYREEKKRFFSHDVLGVAPSSAIDAEILRVCSTSRKKSIAFSIIPVFLRKAVVPVALFAMAFVSAGYIMWNMQNANQMKSAMVNEKQPVAAVQTGKDTAQTAQSVASVDSLNDSIADAKVNFSKTRGNLEGQGVVPVDLKNK